jgi:hypothetical protein
VRFTWINSTQTPIIYEASGISVKFKGPIAAKEKPVTIVHNFTFELTREQYRALIHKCMTYAGVQYSFKQVINIGFANLGIKWKPFKQDSEHAQVCSELGVRILNSLGYKINLDPDMSGPRELYNELIRISDATTK